MPKTVTPQGRDKAEYPSEFRTTRFQSGLAHDLRTGTFDMPARQENNACSMESPIQYTVRQVPREVDQRLRDHCAEAHLSLNEATLEALRRGVGLTHETPVYSDLDSLIGSWCEDPAFDAAIAAQDRVDPGAWK
ncbi:MAG: hypothetical protein RLZ45_1066 [Verrucomicrobiota bacterium]|jgi:hypothetical protein